MAQPIIALVGGFLGAGKTTLLLQVARRLAAQGRRVGIIAAVAKPAQLRKVSDRLQALWPRARVLVLPALTGTGVDRWMAHLGSDEPGGEAILDLAYETYAQAEVALGWMNARRNLRAAHPFSPDGWIEDLLRILGERLRAASAEVAHVKVQLAAPDGTWGANKASITRWGEEPLPASRPCGVRLDEVRSFRPSPPRPTHRLSQPG